MLETEQTRLLEMEANIGKRVVGQGEAIARVCASVRQSRAGLGDPDKPIGSFLFLGPTGVGKTELARAIAEFLFDDERQVIRVDMSEYMEEFSVSRLIGSPPGYVGHQGGRPAHAGRAPPALQRGVAGRDREGPPGGLQSRPEFLEILSGELRPGSKVVADLGQDSDGEPRVVLRPAE